MCAALCQGLAERKMRSGQSQRRDSESIMEKTSDFLVEKKKNHYEDKRERLTTKEHFLSRREFILAEGPLRLNRECQVWLVTSKTHF